MFNIGVEVGQIMFVCGAQTIMHGLKLVEFAWAGWVKSMPG